MRPSTAEGNRKQEADKKEQTGRKGTANRSRIERRAVNITFRPELSQFNLNALVSEHKHLIRQSEWHFNFQQFEKKKASAVLADVKILLIKSLILHFCKWPRIVKEIAPISFPKLTCLNLSGNKICSLQPLQRADLPELQNLFLRQNFLTSLRSLRKCNFRLKFLQISQNRLISIDGLQQLDLSRLIELWSHDNPISFTRNLIKLQMNYPKIKRMRLHKSRTVDKRWMESQLDRKGVRFFGIFQ